MKLKYKAALILLPLISIIAYQVQSYRDFSKDIDNLRETVVIPATEEALLSANIRFLSAQLSTSLQRAIIALQSGHEKGVKEALQKNILTREQRQAELQKLRELSAEFFLQEDKFGTQLAKDLEDIITKVDTLNERMTSQIAASSGTAEEINRISREVAGELVPLENKLLFTLTVVLENSVSKVAETRKIFTEAKKRGVQKLYLVSILSLIVFISIVLFLNFCIVNPIKRLTKNTEIIGKGDLEHRVEIKTRDEIGELGSAFNQMTENLKEVTASRDELNKEITERKQAQDQISRQAAILEAINNVFQEALTCETEEELGRTCLAVAEKLTGSKFGFFGELNPAGLMDDIAISNPGWDACKMAVSHARKFIKDMPIRGIDRSTIREGKSRIVNEDEMATHPDRAGVPEGHPHITAFLGVPLKHEGKTIGMIGLGNKEGGYDAADQEAVESLAVAIVEAVRNKRAEEELEKHKGHLEELVRARTTELQSIVNSMAGREIRMAELKEAIRKLHAQLESAGLTPVADDPLKEMSEG